MFEHKKSVIFISKNKLKIGDVILGPNLKINNFLEYDYQADNFHQILTEIIKSKGTNFRILLSEEFVYVFTLGIPPNIKDEKEFIKIKAQEIVPENLSETVWDFKEVLLAEKKINEPGLKIVQVVATVKYILANLISPIKKLRLQIEAVEPVSFALARLTSQLKNGHIIVYLGEKPLMIAAYQGLVILTESVENELNEQKINQFMDFIKEHFNLMISKLIFCGDPSQVDLKKFENEKFQAEFQKLDPMIGLAIKKDLKGESEKVLNLDILSAPLNIIPDEKISDLKPTLKKSKSFGFKYIFALGAIIILLGFAFTAFYYKNKKITAKTESKLTPSSTPHPAAENKAPEKTSTKSGELSYKIKILNGSGEEGAASSLSDFLKTKSYEIIGTDNADNYDYEDAVIRAKKNVKEIFIKNLNENLKNAYRLVDGDKLKDDDEADVIIIIGKKIKSE